MDIVYMIKKGFTMLELLAGMCVVSGLLIISISNTNHLNLDHYSYMNNYVLTQSQAMLDKQTTKYDKGVYFNSMGHVNQAKTIKFINHEVIIHLGNGYASCK